MDEQRSSAPVRAQAQVDIAASERQVWTVLADIASWPTWNPAIRLAICDEELEIGTRFRFSTEIGTLKCRIAAVDAPRLLSWNGRVLVIGERQTWRLMPLEDGTRVSVGAEMSGIGAHLLRRRLTERLQRVLDAVVQLLRLEAESRVRDEQRLATLAAEHERRALARE